MAGGIWMRKAEVFGGSGQTSSGICVSDEIAVDIGELLLVRAFNPETSARQTNTLGRAASKPDLFLVSDPIESELQRRGPAIEAQDDVLLHCLSY
jgi:hypothetical protein